MIENFHKTKLIKDIHDINLSWFFLAQQLIFHDKTFAMLLLGINDEMATKLHGLEKSQIVKLSEVNQLVFQLFFSEFNAIISFIQSPRIDSLMKLQVQDD